jgi:uncharacterized protein YgbK (DUF1537 family)
MAPPGWTRRCRRSSRRFATSARRSPITRSARPSIPRPKWGRSASAIDLALPVLGSAWTPILTGAPPIRRYQAFGTLFASAPGGVARLDRHPVMARHPVTPMDEADVGRHLSRQTGRRIGLIDLEALADPATAEAARRDQIAAGAALLSLDCIDAASLSACGRLIWEARGPGQFVVGSQGVEYALLRYWRDAGLIPEPSPAAGVGRAPRMAVVSGSVSPITAAQIDWSEANGFAGVAFDARAALDPAALALAEAAAVEAALAALGEGRDPLVFTARGPDDPAVPALGAALAASGLAAEEANLGIGRALGRILETVVRRAGLRRAVISGGDTSGHATRELGVFALTALAPTIPGAAIFRAHGDGAHDGLELALKGGQMGSPDYFGWVRDGGGPRR